MLCLAVLTGPLGPAAIALAQDAPRDPEITKRTPVFLGYLVAAVFLTVLVLLTLFPSKRQQQDL